MNKSGSKFVSKVFEFLVVPNSFSWGEPRYLIFRLYYRKWYKKISSNLPYLFQSFSYGHEESKAHPIVASFWFSCMFHS